MGEYHWLPHAKRRAEERFPEVDLDLELASAKRLTQKQRQRVKTHCPVSAQKYMNGQFAGRYCLITRSEICFVIQAPDAVVTVFQLNKNPTREAKVKQGDATMNHGRFQSILQGQTAVARKVFDATPTGEPRHIKTILATLADKGTPMALNAVEAYIRTLRDAGLVREPETGYYMQIDVKPKTTKEPEMTKKTKESPLSLISQPAPEAGAVDVPAPAKTPFELMAEFATDMRTMAERAEAIAMQIEEAIASKEGELEKFNQFKALMKSMGLAA